MTREFCEVHSYLMGDGRCSCGPVALTLRQKIEALDPYVGIGATGAALIQCAECTEYVQAFKDRVLDIIDEMEER